MSWDPSLQDLVRGYGVHCRAYNEYTQLLGRSKLLDGLEQRLRDLAGLNAPGGPPEDPPEIDLVNYIRELETKIKILEGRQVDQKIGCE